MFITFAAWLFLKLLRNMQVIPIRRDRAEPFIEKQLVQQLVSAHQEFYRV